MHIIITKINICRNFIFNFENQIMRNEAEKVLINPFLSILHIYCDRYHISNNDRRSKWPQHHSVVRFGINIWSTLQNIANFLFFIYNVDENRIVHWKKKMTPFSLANSACRTLFIILLYSRIRLNFFSTFNPSIYDLIFYCHLLEHTLKALQITYNDYVIRYMTSFRSVNVFFGRVLLFASEAHAHTQTQTRQHARIHRWIYRPSISARIYQMQKQQGKLNQQTSSYSWHELSGKNGYEQKKNGLFRIADILYFCCIYTKVFFFSRVPCWLFL